MLPKVVIFRLYDYTEVHKFSLYRLDTVKSLIIPLPYLVHKMQTGTALQKSHSTK